MIEVMIPSTITKENHKGKKTLLGKKIEILIQIFNCDLGRLCRCIIIVRKDHDSTMAL